MHFTAFYTFCKKNLNAPLDIRLVMMAILKTDSSHSNFTVES